MAEAGISRASAPMHFTLKDIERMATAAAVQRGRAYFQQGRVHIMESSGEGIIAEVRGSGRNLYFTRLFTHEDNLYADCSCPVAEDCKHGVATAFAWLAQAPQKSSVNQLDSWLKKLETARNPQPLSLKPTSHHLIYQLELRQQQEQLLATVLLKPMKGYLKKNGEWSQLKPYLYSPYQYAHTTPAFMQPEDEQLLNLLSSYRNTAGFSLRDELGSVALQRALATGRLYARGDSTPLLSGPPRTLEWDWVQGKDSWRLQVAIPELKEWLYLDIDPPCYLDSAARQIGTLQSGLSTGQLRLLQAMPPVPTREMSKVARSLRLHFPAEVLPLPVEPNVVELDTPVPHLTLIAPETSAGFRVPAALLHFQYGPVRAAPNYVADSLAGWEDLQRIAGQDYHVTRDWPREIACCDQLADLGLALFAQIDRWPHVWSVDQVSGASLLGQWRQLEQQAFPELQAQGWEFSVDADYDIPLRPVQLEMRVQDAERHWFDFELTLTLGDVQLSTERVLGHWLENDSPDELLLPTEDGWLQLDTRPLQALRDLIESLFGAQSMDGPVRLPAFRAAQLVDVPELDDRAAPLTRQLAAQLRQFRGLEPVPVPPRLQASLRPYQQQGLDWLHFLHQHGFGGILADDMGLGKTLQTLALLQHLKDRGELQHPALVIAPTSVAGNWLREAAQFTPSLRCLLLHGPRRRDDFPAIEASDLVVTTYPLLLRDRADYQGRHFSLLVLDEAQAVKNPATKLAREVRQLSADCRLCLSGTPLENHLGELWSLLDFALPGLLGSQAHFRQHFRTPIEVHGDSGRQRQLGARVSPFLLRRTKAGVAAELPPKTETIEYVELSGRQRTLYESIRVSMQKRIRDLVARQGMARSHIQFLDALLKLRQACIDPRLVKLDAAVGITESAKLEWLREALPQLLEEGRNLLVFSQFTEVLQLVEQDLQALDIAYSKLTGRTRKRQEAIDQFQRGEVRVFLISLKAGGSGLNLIVVDVVIHLDPWWNPAVEAQASDRAHRIGQDKPVFIYKLIAAGTVEERIQHLQAKKRALADTLFDDADAAGLPQDGESLLALLE